MDHIQFYTLVTGCIPKFLVQWAIQCSSVLHKISCRRDQGEHYILFRIMFLDFGMIFMIYMNYTNFTGCQPSNHYDLSRYIRKKVSCPKREKRGKTSRQPLKKRDMERFKPILVSMASTT